jgi:threonine dehydrogenase-like Zn-dependent dehydrogenase
MKAVTFCNGKLALSERPIPHRTEGETLIRVQTAGICSTDLEIIKGYVPEFCGILGHEFFGTIVEAGDQSLIGKRATAEINCACGTCSFCKNGLGRHCPDRSVIGIVKRDGCFAEYISVPSENVILVPEALPETSAVLIEPLAAALEIFDQVPLSAELDTLLIGDGRLAQIIANVFKGKDYPLAVTGKHPEKLTCLERMGITILPMEEPGQKRFDVVIEASGSPSGFAKAVACVKPRGTIVLKSTYAGSFPFNPAPLVVDEITLVGSRCGRFDEAIRFLLNYRPDFSYLVSARYPIDESLKAMEKAKGKGVLKVLLDM